MITLSKTIIEEEFHCCNVTINAVTVYCHFQKEKAVTQSCVRLSMQKVSSTLLKKTNLQLTAAEAKKQALSNAMLLMFTEKRIIICFLCLKKQSLLFKKCTFKFVSLEDLIKHFKQKHLTHIKENNQLKCKVC